MTLLGEGRMKASIRHAEFSSASVRGDTLSLPIKGSR